MSILLSGCSWDDNNRKNAPLEENYNLSDLVNWNAIGIKKSGPYPSVIDDQIVENGKYIFFSNECYEEIEIVRVDKVTKDKETSYEKSSIN